MSKCSILKGFSTKYTMTKSLLVAVHGAHLLIFLPSPWPLGRSRILFDMHVYRLVPHSKILYYLASDPSTFQNPKKSSCKRSQVFCPTKDTINRAKRQPRKWEKMFENHIPARRVNIQNVLKTPVTQKINSTTTTATTIETT